MVQELGGRNNVRSEGIRENEMTKQERIREWGESSWLYRSKLIVAQESPMLPGDLPRVSIESPSEQLMGNYRTVQEAAKAIDDLYAEGAY